MERMEKMSVICNKGTRTVHFRKTSIRGLVYHASIENSDRLCISHQTGYALFDGLNNLVEIMRIIDELKKIDLSWEDIKNDKDIFSIPDSEKDKLRELKKRFAFGEFEDES